MVRQQLPPKYAVGETATCVAQCQASQRGGIGFARNWRRSVLIVVYFSVATSAAIAAAQATPEERTLQAMTHRGLVDGAVAYASAMRDLSSDDPERHAKWTQRLMECYAQAALRDLGESTAQWKRCESTYQEFTLDSPENARIPWLAWQMARCHLLQVQSNLAAYLAVPGNSETRDKALALIRVIDQELRTLESDIRRRQPLAARQSVSGGKEAPAEQLAKLLVDAGLMRCEALLIRSRLYDAGSRDRIAAAANVEQQAADILKRTGADWPSRGPLQIAAAAALLELGRRDEGLLQLTRLARDSAPGRTSARAAVIAIEHLTAQGEVSRARALLALLERSGSGAEIALARIQLALAELESLQGERREERLRQLVEQSRDIGNQFGGYWRNRAEALLTGSVSADSVSSQSTAALDLINVEVRQLLAAGDEAGAIQRLLHFRDNEAAAGRGASAITLAAKASALLARQQQWSAAADAIEATAGSFSKVPAAPAAHVQAIFAISQALRADTSDKAIIQRYESALVRQLETWPEATETVEPQAWLQRWLHGQQRDADFARILAGRAARCTTANAVRDALRAWLATALTVTDRAQRRELVEELLARIDAGEFGGNAETASAIQLAGFAFSEWPSPSESQRIERRLGKLLTPSTEPADRVLLMAVDLLQRARSGRIAEAARRAPAWQPATLTAAVRLALTSGFIVAVDQAAPDAQGRWAQLLQMDRKWADELLAQDSATARSLGYRILQWNGEMSAALDGLTKLVEEHPRDGRLPLQLASALAASGPNRWNDSMRLARQVAARSEPGSDLYFAARWRIIRNHLLAGSSDEARQAAQLLLAAQPIESEVWKTRFEQVAQSTVP